MDAHFLSPARSGRFVEARGEVVHAAGSTLFLRGGLAVDARPVMSAQTPLKVSAGLSAHLAPRHVRQLVVDLGEEAERLSHPLVASR